MTDIKLERADFVKWLRSQEGQNVGHCGDPYNCPIQTYMQKHYGKKDNAFYVTGTQVLIYNKKGYLPRTLSLEPWARRTIAVVDAYDAYGNPILADDVLALMGED